MHTRGGMQDDKISTAMLLEAWREATRAADLAARLTRLAEEAADQADTDAVAWTEIADLAEQAAEAAKVAQEKSRASADRASALAASKRQSGIGDAQQAEDAARTFESGARDLFHEAQGEALRRQSDEDASRKG